MTDLLAAALVLSGLAIIGLISLTILRFLFHLILGIKP